MRLRRPFAGSVFVVALIAGIVLVGSPPAQVVASTTQTSVAPQATQDVVLHRRPSSTTSTSVARPSAVPLSAARPSATHVRSGTSTPVRITPGAPGPVAPPPTLAPTTTTLAPTTTTTAPTTTTTPPPIGEFKVALVNVDGSAVRWNPCQQIRYVINLQGAPSFARSELTAAIRELEAASGLDFVDAGTTTERPVNRPLRDVVRYGPGYSPILISFATAAELPFGSPAASGWGQARWVVAPDGNKQLVSGQVVLRPDHGWTSGISSSNPLSLMFQHELGHVVGLGHVASTKEIMGTAGNGTVRRWGPGDLVGLQRVGRPAGCLPVLS